jgi:putative DNA primase/helicase
MSTTLSPILEKVLSRLNDPRETAGRYQARCPAHDDHRASLSVNLGDDGRVLLHCFAGCATADVVKALGLTMKDLFPPTNGHPRLSNGRGSFNVIAAYSYRDERGEPLYEACRLDPKDFVQRRPNGKGGYEYKTKGVRKVLYRLPELIGSPADKVVCIAEGEKDIENLVKLGYTATCNVGGAGKWRKEYGEHLRGRKVVVLADADQAGRDHADDVANKLQGIAAEVKVLELPGAKDVSDWIAAGGTREQLDSLIEFAPIYSPAGKSPTKKKAARKIIVGEPQTLDLREASGRTDVANSRRLAAKHGATMRWCEPWGKWLIWDGRRWAIDDHRRAEALAKGVADDIWREVGELLPKVELAEQSELLSFARRTASAFGLGAILALARSEDGIPIVPAQLDSHPWKFNCINGTVDLKTGRLNHHDQGDYLTKLCRHEYLGGAESECPLWESTLDKIFKKNDQLIGFVRRLFGSAMSGKIIEHILPILWGSGSNGKTLIIETLLEAIGEDYAGRAVADLLLATKGDRHPTEVADLFGKRLVVCAETEEGRRFNESKVKELCGGDTVKARRMREDFWQFKPSHTLFLVTNHKPVVRGQDDGIWRRLRLVPFTQRFWQASKGETGPEDLKADPRLKERLRPELPGIMCWLVNGCLEWQRDGLGQPAEVTAATNDYKTAMDTLGQFVDDCCELNKLATSKASDVRARYEEWCKHNGEKPVSGRRFGEYLSDRGVVRRTSNGVWYDGLALR